MNTLPDTLPVPYVVGRGSYDLQNFAGLLGCTHFLYVKMYRQTADILNIFCECRTSSAVNAEFYCHIN